MKITDKEQEVWQEKPPSTGIGTAIFKRRQDFAEYLLPNFGVSRQAIDLYERIFPHRTFTKQYHPLPAAVPNLHR